MVNYKDSAPQRLCGSMVIFHNLLSNYLIYKDIFSDTIELTDERWLHIVKEHPEIKQYKERIQEVLTSPDYIKVSTRNAEVLFYYKFYSDIYLGKYILVVAKKSLRSFILTCYITDLIKKGETLWEKK